MVAEEPALSSASNTRSTDELADRRHGPGLRGRDDRGEDASTSGSPTPGRSCSHTLPRATTRQWARDIQETQGTAPNYPIIADNDFNVAKLYGMLPAETSGDAKSRTPADNQTVRNVFVVGPDKKLKLMLVYPMTTGRNFDEVLRVIDSLQLTAKHKVATPAQWQPGDDVIIAGSVSDEQAKEIFGEWESPRPYIRLVPQP
jgi:hypothetical protein